MIRELAFVEGSWEGLASEELCALARWCSARGWVPATSGNFSFRDRVTGRVFITASGLDKGALEPGDLMELDADGRVVAGVGRPSAETALHTVVYARRPEVGAIAHVHTVANTLLSKRWAEKRAAEGAAFETCGHGGGTADTGEPKASETEGGLAGGVALEGYELLKALSGVRTHDHREVVPVLANSQDYALLARQLELALAARPGAHGVLLSGHGLYAWGETIAEAKRHVEALEFLFECEARRQFGWA